MSTNSNFDQFDLNEELDEVELEGTRPKIRNRVKERRRPRLKDRFGIIDELEVVQAIQEQADDRRTIQITYKASKTEAHWLLESLGGMFENGWFDDVVQIVKGGKEASVYQCRGNAMTGREWLAAKVYRPRIFRALRNDAMYKEGRAMLDEDGLVIRREGPLKAIRNRTQLGDRLIHQSWIMHEVHALQRLHVEGYDVPAVFANGDNAILMDFIGDADMPAPVLNDVHLESAEAQRLFERVLHNIEGMLAADLVHGDLSAYNILYWRGEIILIDFPQVVIPKKNHSAYDIFSRDVRRVCEYFQRQGVQADPERLAARMWSSRGLRPGLETDPTGLDPDSEADRAHWERYGKVG